VSVDVKNHTLKKLCSTRSWRLFQRSH